MSLFRVLCALELELAVCPGTTVLVAEAWILEFLVEVQALGLGFRVRI